MEFGEAYAAMGQPSRPFMARASGATRVLIGLSRGLMMAETHTASFATH
mgnify:CR=1 FL=1